MGNLKPDEATNTDMTNTVTDWSVTPVDTNTNDYTVQWSTWNGYYRDVSELKAVIDKKAIWSVGKGIKADKKTLNILDGWRGMGKDTANDIYENLIKTYTIGGDSFAEIIRSPWKKAANKIFNTNMNTIKNLKPLNPGNIKIVADKFGIITHYEWNKVNSGSSPPSPPIIFKPEEMFHLPWNRVGDNIHGTSTIESIQNIIESLKEAKADLRVVFHRYVKPLLIASVDTDDTQEIADFKTKMDTAVENAENMVIPKDTVDNIERISIPQFSTLDPLPWIRHLLQEFIRASGVPDVVLGVGDDSTEATSKIVYLAFQQVIEHNQNFLVRQTKAQLGLDIEFEFPASLEPLLFDQQEKSRSMNNMEMGMDAKK